MEIPVKPALCVFPTPKRPIYSSILLCNFLLQFSYQNFLSDVFFYIVDFYLQPLRNLRHRTRTPDYDMHNLPIEDRLKLNRFEKYSPPPPLFCNEEADFSVMVLYCVLPLLPLLWTPSSCRHRRVLRNLIFGTQLRSEHAISATLPPCFYSLLPLQVR